MFTGFTQDALDFLQDIRFNNNQTFYEQNKERYEKHVKAPLRLLSDEMIPVVQLIDSRLDTRPGRTMSRIRRDTRYTKDKSPFRDHVWLGWRYPGESRSEGFGSEVKKRIMLGTFALSSGYYDAYYKKALQVRSLVRKDFDDAFGKCDFIISPVAPTVAYKIGEKTGDSLQMYMGDAYSVPVNIAGIPALTLPCGIGEGGMPVGMQLIGPAFSEGLLYRAGFAFESTGK